jgi:hypothetical protein
MDYLQGVKDEFVSEQLTPVPGTIDMARMAAGEPGLPRQFKWRNETIEIARVVRTWRGMGPCSHGSGETYLRRHGYEVETTAGMTLTIYFDRQPRTRSRKARWWLYTVRRTGA